MTDFESRKELFENILNKSGKGQLSDKFWGALEVLYVLGELVPSKKPDNPYARFKNNGKLTVLKKNKANQLVQSRELSSFIEFFINLIVQGADNENSELGVLVSSKTTQDERELCCRCQLYEVMKKVPLVQLPGRTDDYFHSACEIVFGKSYVEVHADLFECFEPSTAVGVLPAETVVAPSSEAPAHATVGDTESEDEPSSEPEPVEQAPPAEQAQPAEQAPPEPEPTEQAPPEPEPAEQAPPKQQQEPLQDIAPLVDGLHSQDLQALLARFRLPEEGDVLPRDYTTREPPRVAVPPSDYPELKQLQDRILELKSGRCPELLAKAQAKIKVPLGAHQQLAAQQVWHLAADPLTGCKAALCLPPGKGKTLVALAFAEMGEFRLAVVVSHNAEGKINWVRQLDNLEGASVVAANSGGLRDTMEAFWAAQDILENPDGKVYVVLTPESLSSAHHTCLVNDYLSFCKSCLIVDEPHLNFKDPGHEMGNHLAEITRFTEHQRIPCVFVTGTLCSRPEDACLWLSGALFSRQLPLGCLYRNAPEVAQAVLRLLEVRMEDARPAMEVPEGVIWDVNVAEPSNLDPDSDPFKQQWWFTGLELEDIQAIKYALVGAVALLRQGHGSVFFVNNVRLIDKIKEALAAPCMGTRFLESFFFIHGELSDNERRAAYEGFLDKGGVLVITPGIGGIGLNFTSRAGAHLVKAVFLLCPEFDREALLQLLGRAARSPNELRGVMFRLTNASKEHQRVDRIIHDKQQGSQHQSGERLVKVPGAVSRKRPLDAEDDDRQQRRKVLKLEDAAAAFTGLFYAAQCGEAINTRTGEFWVHQCSPLQPSHDPVEARRRSADLKRKLGSAEQLEAAMRDLRLRAVTPRPASPVREEPGPASPVRKEPRQASPVRDEPGPPRPASPVRNEPGPASPTPPQPSARASTPPTPPPATLRVRMDDYLKQAGIEATYDQDDLDKMAAMSLPCVSYPVDPDDEFKPV